MGGEALVNRIIVRPSDTCAAVPLNEHTCLVSSGTHDESTTEPIGTICSNKNDGYKYSMNN